MVFNTISSRLTIRDDPNSRSSLIKATSKTVSITPAAPENKDQILESEIYSIKPPKSLYPKITFSEQETTVLNLFIHEKKAAAFFEEISKICLARQLDQATFISDFLFHDDKNGDNFSKFLGMLVHNQENALSYVQEILLSPEERKQNSNAITLIHAVLQKKSELSNLTIQDQSSSPTSQGQTNFKQNASEPISMLISNTLDKQKETNDGETAKNKEHSQKMKIITLIYEFLSPEPVLNENISLNVDDGIHLLDEINLVERRLKEIEHIENGVSSLDENKQNEIFTWHGLKYGFFSNTVSNFFSSQSQTIDMLEGPYIEEYLDHTGKEITKILTSIATNAIAALILVFNRKNNRVNNTDNKSKFLIQKECYTLYFSALLKIFDSHFGKSIKIPDILIKKAERYQDNFQLNRKKFSTGLSEKDNNVINFKVNQLDCVIIQDIKEQIKLVKSDTSNINNVDNLNLKIKDYIRNIVITQIHESGIEFKSKTDFLSKIDKIKEVLIPIDLTNEDIDYIYASINDFENNSSKKDLDLNKLTDAIKNKVKNFIFGNVFKTNSKSIKIYKFDKSRGSLFSQIIQLYNKSSSKKGFINLIQLGLNLNNEANSEKKEKTIFKEIKKQLADIKEPNRTNICKAYDDIITNILNANISSKSKKILLVWARENIPSKTIEKRHLHTTEAIALPLAYQSYNFTRIAAEFGGSSEIANIEELIGIGEPGVIFPAQDYLSKSENTTTNLSLINMLNSAIKYVDDLSPISDKNSQHNLDDNADNSINQQQNKKSLSKTKKDTIDLIYILDKKTNNHKVENKKDIDNIFNILNNLKKQGLLEVNLESKGERKTILLLELLNKLPTEESQKLLKIYYSKENFNNCLSPNFLIGNNNLQKFTKFLSDELDASQKSKKDTALVVAKGMAYLCHIYTEIKKIPNTNFHKEKQIQIYQHCKQRFEEMFDNSLTQRFSKFGILASHQNRKVILALKSVGKFLSRLPNSYAIKSLQNILIPSMKVALCLSGMGIAIALVVTITAYTVRMILNTLFNHPRFYKSTNTRTFSILTKQFKKLPNFEMRLNKKSTRDRFEEIIADFKTSYPSENFKKIFHKKFELFFGSLNRENDLTQEFNLFINEMKEQDSTKLCKKAFHKITELTNLNKAIFIDKSDLTESFVRALYICYSSNLSKANKIDILRQLGKEMNNEKSIIGSIKRHNSFIREKNYFILEILSSVAGIIGTISRLFLLPALLTINIILAVFGNSLVSSLSYPIRDKIFSFKFLQSPFGKTRTSQYAESLISFMINDLEYQK